MNSLKVQAAQYMYQWKTNRQVFKRKIHTYLRNKVPMPEAIVNAQKDLQKDGLSKLDYCSMSLLSAKLKLQSASAEKKPVLEKVVEILHDRANQNY